MWESFLFAILFCVYAYLVLTTILVVVLENRQPAKTIAWILVLLLLPLLGLVIFYFFGQNVRKERRISRKQMTSLMQKNISEHDPQKVHSTSETYAPLIFYFKHQSLSPVSESNRLCFYKWGADYLVDLIRAIADAKNHIHLETYIFEDDSVGRLVRDALFDAVGRGVKVRLIYDDVGCWTVKQRFFDEMQQKGIEILNFMPVRFPRFTRKVNYRNHRKICIIDGCLGFMGGMNIAYRYVQRSRGHRWCDRHMRVEGHAVYALQRVFFMDWYFMSRELIRGTNYFPAFDADFLSQTSPVLMQIVPSEPIGKWPDIMNGFTWAIRNARKYVYIQSPYFMPTESFLEALQIAAMSGIDVRLMLPTTPDARLLKLANNAFYADVLRANVKIYSYEPGFLHAKTVVVDDNFCSIGSTNMDFRSFENNFEINAFIYNAEIAKQVKAQFVEDMQQCTRIYWNIWKRRPYWQRVRESIIRVFSPLL